MDEKILDKIKKLLSLSNSPNENESQLAMLKAQELMVKHRLSMKDVLASEIKEEIIEKDTGVSFTHAKWKAHLAGLLADNFRCYYFFKRYRTNFVVFFGREEDVEICCFIFKYAVDCIYKEVKKLQRQSQKEGRPETGIENDYSLGFLLGLRHRFEEQKKANQEWGLVLVKDPEVVKSYENIQFKSSKDTSMGFKGRSSAFRKGQEDGKNFDISNKLNEGNERKNLAGRG
jgi:hypothetical protein